MKEIEKIYQNTESFTKDRLQSLASATEQNYLVGRFDLVAQNVGNATNLAVTQAMARMRFSGDISSTLKALNEGAAFAHHVFKVESALRERKEKGESLPKEKLLHAYSLWWPLLCCLLAGDWIKARNIADLLSSPVVIEGDVGGVVHYLVELLSAIVLDDKEQFLTNRLIKKPLKEKQPVFAPFVQLAETVMQRDQHGFDAQLMALHEDFSHRAKSRVGGLEEYGYGQVNNSLCLDFQSIAVCKIAIKRGMNVTIESEYIPLALVNYWQP